MQAAVAVVAVAVVKGMSLGMVKLLRAKAGRPVNGAVAARTDRPGLEDLRIDNAHWAVVHGAP